MNLFEEEDKLPDSTLKPFHHILLFSAVSFLLGLSVVFTTIVISEDGSFYIELARALEVNLLRNVSDTGQSPGYPLLIILFHKLLNVFIHTTSLYGWILSGQLVSLLGKGFSLFFIYCIGKNFVGNRYSFWGVLILTVLPDSVFWGSDVLTDWPNILFLTAGIWFLIRGLQCLNIWMFGLAGIVSGYGYLVRPECGQIIIYGIIWVLFYLFIFKRMSVCRAFGCLLVLCAGFSILAVPYMIYKGYVFPERGMWEIPSFTHVLPENGCSVTDLVLYQCASVFPSRLTAGPNSMINNLCETLVYWFIPGLLIGFAYWLKKADIKREYKYLASTYILFNVGLGLFQSIFLEFLGRRHTLVLVILTVMYIPIGLQVIAEWINNCLDKNQESKTKDTRNLFYILCTVGICICGIKFIRLMPFRWEKQGYREAARWLAENTKETDIIAIPDRRIAFYAQRIGLKYDNLDGCHADYIVILNKNSLVPDECQSYKQIYSVWLNRKKKELICIYEANR